MTGLNEAFWVSQAIRDKILMKNPEAKEVLKPLVIGDDVRRWAIRQDEPRYLIYTPKNRYTDEAFRDRFPALAAHLNPFRSFAKNGKTVGLDHRATNQQWFELQQAQEAYEGYLNLPKLIWPDLAMIARFTIGGNSFQADTTFFIPGEDWGLLGLLNAKRTWKDIQHQAASLGDPLNGGRVRLKQYVLENLLLPPSVQDLGTQARPLSEIAKTLESHRSAFLHFLRQDTPWQVATVGEKLENFWELDEASVLAEALKRRNKKLKKDPTLGEREDLKRLWREAAEPIRELTVKIQKLEAELDMAVEAAWEA